VPTLKITGVHCVNQNGQDATLFDPFTDALALTLDIYASADLIGLAQRDLHSHLSDT
jgi:hypothetical protein